jgi:hypothetical protein
MISNCSTTLNAVPGNVVSEMLHILNLETNIAPDSQFNIESFKQLICKMNPSAQRAPLTPPQQEHTQADERLGSCRKAVNTRINI